jgi:beta-lactamase regulating signal transducer with metallopeptidase domain
MMDHLLQAAVRSVLLAAVAALGLWRVKSASIRHAVWTLVTAGMLAQIALSPVLPEIPLRVLRSAPPVAMAVASLPIAVAASSSESRDGFSWEQIAAAVYLCGLLFFAARLIHALVFAVRLVRASEPAGTGIYQSHCIAAPMTIGSRILLPLSWREWDAVKLQAVLVHEQAHVRRHDWAVAAMAGLNRSVFWFHPLAWWLERELARLAEQACDDAALAVVQDREQYARTLLDIARSIQFSKGRVLAAPMAKEANVETRINRILDETRRIPKALGRRGWTALAVSAAPLMYLAAAIQLAPAQTVMAVPQPVQPLPPVATIAQAATPQTAPLPPKPAGDSSQKVSKEERQRTDEEAERQRLVSEAEHRLALLQARELEMKALEAEIRAQRQRAVEAQSEPAIMNTEQNRLAAIQALERKLIEAQALVERQQRRAEVQGQNDISVDVSPERTVTLGIPLGGVAQGEVIVMIGGRDGNPFNLGLRRPINGPKLDVPVSLKTGAYHVTATILNAADGSRETREFDFNVK